MRFVRIFIVAIAAVLAATTVRAQEQAPSTEDTPAAERGAEDLLLDVLQEIAELRQSVAELTDEVTAIRIELAVPRPGIVPGAARVEVSAPDPGSESVASGPPEGAASEQALEPPPEERVFSVTIVKEWGRSVEEAQRLLSTSLLGQILTVPSWSTRQELEDIGRALQAKYAAYDNVNIEVFNDPVVAAAYAERPVARDPAARVLTVSKVKDSGRDKVLLFVGETVIEVQ